MLSASLYIGFITYGDSTAKYLPYFLDSLKNQTFSNFKIIAVDNSDIAENKNLLFIKNNYSEIDIIHQGENLGFSQAYNLMIDQAINNNADYFLAVNPDMIFEADMVEKLIAVIDSDNKLASIQPKILSWNFAENKKENIVDSYGINILPGLRFIDIKQGEKDQLDKDIEIAGPTGAAALYRLDSLKKIKIDSGYFDESFFLYKEDCDLAYRLFLKGYGSKCIHNAVAYHDRTARKNGGSVFDMISDRRDRGEFVNKQSFRGQQLIYKKYWHQQTLSNKMHIIVREVKFFILALFFERYLLKEFFILFKHG